jgi:nucleoside-diphosphate-sugar epimerase
VTLRHLTNSASAPPLLAEDAGERHKYGVIAVLGARGALGAAVVEQACARGAPVRALVRAPRAHQFPTSAEQRECDALDLAAVTRETSGCSALVFAVNVPIASWMTQMPVLLDIAIQAARATGARLIFPGNVWIYGPGQPGQRIDEARPATPCSERGALRAKLEASLAAADIHYSIVRLPEFYGPNVVNALVGAPFRAAARSRPVLWLGELDVTVEYVFIRDAAAAVLDIAGAADCDRESFNIEGAGGITPRKFWNQVIALAAARGRVWAVPRWLLRVAALTNPEARAFLDIRHLWTDPILLDGTKYRARFKPPAPTPYAQGAVETLGWFRQHDGAK